MDTHIKNGPIDVFKSLFVRLKGGNKKGKNNLLRHPASGQIPVAMGTLPISSMIVGRVGTPSQSQHGLHLSKPLSRDATLHKKRNDCRACRYLQQREGTTAGSEVWARIGEVAGV